MRPLRFTGDSLEVLRRLPEEVKNEIGFALERVQRGKMPENAKPLKGIAAGVLEIVSDFRAILSVPFTRCGSPKPSTFCMYFKRSRSGVSRRRSAKFNSYRSASGTSRAWKSRTDSEQGIEDERQ